MEGEKQTSATPSSFVIATCWGIGNDIDAFAGLMGGGGGGGGGREGVDVA